MHGDTALNIDNDYFDIALGGTTPPGTTATTLTYTGPERLANGEAAHLTGTLRGGAGVAGRTVHFTLGSGDTAQSCSDSTDADRHASGSTTVHQPLNDTATVPLTAPCT